jgi:hypothetical protein
MKVFLVAPQPENDPAAEITVEWVVHLEEFLRNLDDENIVVVPFFRSEAVRANVEAALKEDKGNKGIFVFIDHGEKDKLPGSDDQALIDTENIHLLKNKLIYAVACKSASSLGHEALKNNIASYIGFIDRFHIMPTASNTYGHCFLSGIKAIILQKVSSLEAMEKVKNEIKWIIHKLKTRKKIPPITRNTVITSLMHNLNCMVCLGDTDWRIGS